MCQDYINYCHLSGCPPRYPRGKAWRRIRRLAHSRMIPRTLRVILCTPRYYAYDSLWVCADICFIPIGHVTTLWCLDPFLQNIVPGRHSILFLLYVIVEWWTFWRLLLYAHLISHTYETSKYYKSTECIRFASGSLAVGFGTSGWAKSGDRCVTNYSFKPNQNLNLHDNPSLITWFSEIKIPYPVWQIQFKYNPPLAEICQEERTSSELSQTMDNKNWPFDPLYSATLLTEGKKQRWLHLPAGLHNQGRTVSSPSLKACQNVNADQVWRVKTPLALPLWRPLLVDQLNWRSPLAPIEFLVRKECLLSGVMVKPGAYALTVIPCLPTSSAADKLRKFSL